MSPKKLLTLIKDTRYPSQLRGVTKTTKRNSKNVEGTVGKYQVKVCLTTSNVVIPNFDNAKDAAKVFAGYYEMKGELRAVYSDAKMDWPNLTTVTCEDVIKNGAVLDKEIMAKEKELTLLKRKRRASNMLLTFKKTFVSASKALKLISERYNFA